MGMGGGGGVICLVSFAINKQLGGGVINYLIFHTDSIQYVTFGGVTKITHKSMSVIPQLGGKLILRHWISTFQVCTMVMLKKKSFFNCYMTYRMRTITVLWPLWSI